MSERRRHPARAFTLVELLIGIVITGMVALAIATMMTMVGSSTVRTRDDRSVLMRAHLAQVRVRAYVENALCVLAHDPDQGMALWLHDGDFNDRVNLTEMRVLWFNADEQTVTIERVDFGNTDEEDEIVPIGADYFGKMREMRDKGHTVTETMLETVSSFDSNHTGETIQGSDQFRFGVSLVSDAGETREVFIVVGLPNHQEPSA